MTELKKDREAANTNMQLGSISPRNRFLNIVKNKEKIRKIIREIGK